jgi:sec-independent protein translocase protein TatA
MNLTSIFAFLGNLGGPEIFLIVLFVLIFFGAKKIPELARGLGKGIREFKDATKEIKDEIEESVSEDKKVTK